MSKLKTWIPDRLPPVVLTDLLRMADQSLRVEIEGYFSDLDTLTPIKATLKVQHQGTFLKVTGTAEAIVTLTCDRCELIWVQQDRDELPLGVSEDWDDAGDLIESLPATGEFDWAQWLYEQLCLTLPHQQLCNQSCPGPATIDSSQPPELIDHRWAALAKLKQ